ncbi:MAG: radical SAM protein [Nitrospirae bacterium]|nr:radical SAM protein [Nitrospirota bacterium]MBF0554814.1 radical SAM protein [Nitrospirota bacterium]
MKEVLEISEKHEVRPTELLTVVRKTLLNESEVEYADYAINHVEGCSHGCKFPCYAFVGSKKNGRVKTYEEWCRPKIVSNALELLDREIPKKKKKIDFVHLCFMTDPFMYQHPEVSDLTLQIIQKLNASGIRCTTLTKGIIPAELADLDRYSDANEYGITLVSLSEEFRKVYEPGAAKFEERIAALKELHRNGCKTWVSVEPFPTPNIFDQDLLEILDAVGFVDKIVFGRLNYNTLASKFKGVREYYNSLALAVINFCQQNGIACHIKEGTQT